MPVDPWTRGPVDPWTRGPVDPWTRGPVDPWSRAPDGACRRCAPQRPATRRIIDSDIVRTIIIPLEVAHG
ncbi:hypothetical protein MCC10120_1128 [Bifidobacterium longum subsp. longum]|uniref:Uncharacterized protein n=1 Tax=Bifidobacterium longum subsp. longum TaxID=1679 RepID=A0A4R0WGJ4_BIFLL|nr:hypothetical protein MCC10120_1128 [Bifidobacterium longum subsp. longum]